MTTSRFQMRTPAQLIAIRAALGLLLPVGAILHLSRPLFLVGVFVGFLSDVFDGIIARRLRIVTERLRVADSRADGAFYVGIAIAIWRMNPEIVRAYRAPLLLVIVLQLSSYAIDLIKYRRIASFHSYVAKIWGITLLVAIVGMVGFRQGACLWPAIVVGVIGNVEAMMMKMVLPRWECDVSSLRHALKLRREEERRRSPETTEVSLGEPAAEIPDSRNDFPRSAPK